MIGIDSSRLTQRNNSPCVGCELGMIAVREISADRDRWRGEALTKQYLEEESKVKKLEAENEMLRQSLINLTTPPKQKRNRPCLDS